MGHSDSKPAAVAAPKLAGAELELLRVGYDGKNSSSFLIEKNGSWYYIYDARGNKIKTLSVSTVGKVLSVSGETFTSQLGS